MLIFLFLLISSIRCSIQTNPNLPSFQLILTQKLFNHVCRDILRPLVRDQVLKLQIPVTHVDIGYGFDLTLSDMVMDSIEIPMVQVQAIPEKSGIEIVMGDMGIELHGKWLAFRESFPSVTASGSIKVSIKRSEIKLLISPTRNNGLLALNLVDGVGLLLREIRIVIEDSGMDWLYNLIIHYAMDNIRNNVQKKVKDAINVNLPKWLEDISNLASVT